MAIELTTASESVIDSIRASLSAVGSDTIKEIVDITRANYNALTKDPKTLYVVNEGVGVNRSFLLGTARIDFSGSISGNLSASGLVYASGGNSSTWNSTTNIININSAKWNSNSTTVSVNSASWIGSTTIVAANSANWVLDGGNTKGANLVIGTNDANNFNLETSGTARVSISSTGQVGIGTTTPDADLVLYKNVIASPTTFKIRTATGTTSRQDFYRTDNYVATRFNVLSTNEFQFFNNDDIVTPKYIINGTNGNFGIGTSSTAEKVTIGGNLSASGALRALGNITSFGNVGIGTSLPVSKLDIYDTTTAQGLSGAALNIYHNWNAGSVDVTAIKLNVFSSGSGINSKFLDLQLNGTSYFNVSKLGNVSVIGTLSAARIVSRDLSIGSSTIDWSTSNSFYKTILTNTTFTFSNTLPGQSITVAISAAGSYNITWPATVIWSGNIAPKQTASATDIYFFHNINNIVYGNIITEAGLSKTFTNSQIRLSTIPYRVGLIGFQIDTGEVWVSIGQTAGDWQLVSGAGGVPPSHEHAFSEIHSLPSYPPAALDVIGVPLGEASSRLTHWASLSLILDLAQVPRSARDTLLALNDAGAIISDTKLAAIDTFYKYADSVGLITGNTDYARLLVPVWSNNTKANLIDWLHPANSIKPYTRNASTGANNAGNFNADTVGYMQPTGVTNSGMIDFNSTVAQIWEATDYCFTYYSHLPPLTDDNTMIGARNDTVSGGTGRWFTTSRSVTDAGVFRAAAGSSGGSLHVNLVIPELYVGGTVGALNPLGLIHFARKGTLFSTRRRGAAGILNTTDLTTASAAANAVITNLKLGGFLYYNGNPTGSLNAGSALHSQPSSLFYLGRAIATTNTATDTFSLNLYNLAVSMGAPVV